MRRGNFWIFNLILIGMLFYPVSCKKDSNTTKQEVFTGKVTDIDGNIYDSVTIGTQVWMVQNLKATKYNDGTDIQNVTDPVKWNELTTPGYCWYNNDSASNKNKYGALYNWYAINTEKLCPKGWHVPTEEEWTKLENYLIANLFNYDNSTIGNKYAKSIASDFGWPLSTNEGSVGNTDYSTKRNLTGFNALPGGTINFYGTFNGIGFNTAWWTSTQKLTFTEAYYHYINYDKINVGRDDVDKHLGFSVRCIKD